MKTDELEMFVCGWNIYYIPLLILLPIVYCTFLHFHDLSVLHIWVLQTVVFI